MSHQLVLLEASRLISATVGIAHQAGGISHDDHGLSVVEDLAGEVAFALQLSLKVLHLGDIEKDSTILEDLALAVANHERVLQSVDHGAIATAQRDLKVPHRAVAVQLAQDLQYRGVFLDITEVKNFQ